MKVDDSFRSLLKKRKTNRKQKRDELPQSNLKELVWAAFGHTHDYRGVKMRTAPSAGATYPIELFFACEDIKGKPNGLYHYDIESEDMSKVSEGGFLQKIQAISYDQQFFSQCNLAIIMVYNPTKIISDYKENSLKYAAIECGHIGQNILLMATSLGLGAVPVGAFDEKKLDKLIGIEDFKQALYLISVGMLP